MRWFKRSSDKEILSLVKVNDRIQLEVKRNQYLSRVEDIRSEMLLVAAPVDDGCVVSLFPGTEVVLKLFLPGGVRRFSSRVKRMYSGRVPILEMAKFSDLGVLQRRNYPRATVKLPVQFRTDISRGNPGRWCEGTTVDMSIGGVQIYGAYTTSHISVGDFVEIRLAMPDRTEIPAICRVGRVQTRSNRFAVEFVEIQPEAQERIARHIEQRWLESEADRRRYVRCKVPINVSYKQAGGPFQRTSSQDISTGGLRMLTSGDSFVMGETLDLTIELPHKELHVKAVVVWVGAANKRGQLEIGVKFARMDRRSHDALARFLLTVQRGETKSKAA
ncbi:MAG TPA: flagellar brake protein [Armatimonadota bacterium]|nr:flagellar brake protein [Armatimonadota bacterium]